MFHAPVPDAKKIAVGAALAHPDNVQFALRIQCAGIRVCDNSSYIALGLFQIAALGSIAVLR
jgi:hypothetical protein